MAIQTKITSTALKEKMRTLAIADTLSIEVDAVADTDFDFTATASTKLFIRTQAEY